MLEQDAVLEGLVPALDLALGLRVAWCAADVRHASPVEPFRQVARDVGGAVVGQQSRPMDNRDLIQSGGRQSQVERLGDIAGAHRGTELPGHDEA